MIVVLCTSFLSAVGNAVCFLIRIFKERISRTYDTPHFVAAMTKLELASDTGVRLAFLLLLLLFRLLLLSPLQSDAPGKGARVVEAALVCYGHGALSTLKLTKGYSTAS